MPVSMPVSFLHLVGAHLTAEQLVQLLQVRVQVFGMGYVPDGLSGQFAFRVAQ